MRTCTQRLFCGGVRESFKAGLMIVRRKGLFGWLTADISSDRGLACVVEAWDRNWDWDTELIQYGLGTRGLFCASTECFSLDFLPFGKLLQWVSIESRWRAAGTVRHFHSLVTGIVFSYLVHLDTGTHWLVGVLLYAMSLVYLVSLSSARWLLVGSFFPVVIWSTGMRADSPSRQKFNSQCLNTSGDSDLPDHPREAREQMQPAIGHKDDKPCHEAQGHESLRLGSFGLAQGSGFSISSVVQSDSRFSAQPHQASALIFFRTRSRAAASSGTLQGPRSGVSR